MASQLPLIAVSSGEPAGIGPDICLALAAEARHERIVVLGDPNMLRERARQLGSNTWIRTLAAANDAQPQAAGELQVIEHRVRVDVRSGSPDSRNAAYVLDLLADGGSGCLEGRYAALVTAPVHKSVICASGVAFTGHTEFLAQLCGSRQPVMLLTRDDLRVALVTTHLPLRDVPAAISADRIRAVATVLNEDLRHRFGISQPRILVLGLNPHAGEDGTLGTEESEIIAPTLAELRRNDIDVTGPRPADTAFTAESLAGFDAVLAMYHDQGLTPIKAAGFGRIVNVTLGLPIIRTSVDHGTALSLAGTGKADAQSLRCAVELAAQLIAHRAAA
jgi:4-hydroxythreonine-4-phosphate dehydrogenase